MIRVGVQTWGTDVAALRRYWTAAEDLGFDRVVYGDGLWGFTHDGWTMLGALATLTRRVRVGPAVTYAFAPSSHHPSWLAKRAVTVDHLSEGRLDVRLGVGAEDPETARLWRSHGIAYPSAGERIARLDETVRVMHALWAGAPVDHAGTFHDLSGAVLEPRPVQRAGPPVWIAAMRPRALALVARCADGWEASYVTPEQFARKGDDLRRGLEAERRAASAVARSVELDVALATSRARAASAIEAFCRSRGIAVEHPLVTTALAGEPEAVAARIADYVAAGATDLTLGFTDFPSTAMLEQFAARVRPRLAGLAGDAVSRRSGGRGAIPPGA